MSKYVTSKIIESMIGRDRGVIEAGLVGEISIYITDKHIFSDMSTSGNGPISVQMLQGAAKLLESLRGVTKVTIDSSEEGAVMGVVIDRTEHTFVWNDEGWR